MSKFVLVLILITLGAEAAKEHVRTLPLPEGKMGAIYIGEKNGYSLTVEIEVSSERDWERTLKELHGGWNTVEGILFSRFKQTGTDDWYPYYTNGFIPFFDKRDGGNQFCVLLYGPAHLLIEMRKNGVNQIIGDGLTMDLREEGVCLSGPGLLAKPANPAAVVPKPAVPKRIPSPPARPTSFEDL